MVEINRVKVGERINNIRISGNWTLEEFGILINNTHLPKVSDSPSLGGYTLQSFTRTERKRSEKEVEQDYKELKEQINETLDSIISRNIANHRG